jgi:hypothetical protein
MSFQRKNLVPFANFSAHTAPHVPSAVTFFFCFLSALPLSPSFVPAFVCANVFRL